MNWTYKKMMVDIASTIILRRIWYSEKFWNSSTNKRGAV